MTCSNSKPTTSFFSSTQLTQKAHKILNPNNFQSSIKQQSGDQGQNAENTQPHKWDIFTNGGNQLNQIMFSSGDP
jgi:hypothetical protein